MQRVDEQQDQVAKAFQTESGRVIAALMSKLHDLELVEDALQDALVIALERWPLDGVPRNPGAWMTTTAMNRAIDRLRRNATLERKRGILKMLIELEQEDPPMFPEDIPDERLKLIFTCCHPALAQEAQVALTLQTLGGLTTSEIASAFLVPLATMSQRLVRAKRKIRDAGIPYEVPTADSIPERMESVLSVLYLIFNAGYTAPEGNDLIRHDLCAEAIRLTSVLATLLAQDSSLQENAEGLGLFALMLLHDARRNARVAEDGALILLEDQDRTLWDQKQITDGIIILERALAMHQPGPYQIQAAIAALHAEAKSADETDWEQITRLYDVLYGMLPNPVVALNRAVAVAMSQSPEAGLRLLDELETTEELKDYYLFHAARGDLLRRTGWLDEARLAYQRALSLTQNRIESRFLSRRLAEISRQLETWHANDIH